MSEPQGYTQAVVDILNSQLGQSITQAFTAGEEHERERIIKLLEEQGCDCHNAYCDKLPTAALNSLIAFIKGENK